MVNFDTPQLKVLKRVTDAYCSLDLNNLNPLFSKDYRYEALPEIPGISIQTKEDYVQIRREVYSLLSKLEVVYHEAIEAPGKVIAHSTRTYSTTFGATYTYDTLSILTLVEEDGELKVLHCKDFADPQQRAAHAAGAAKATAERVTA